MLMILNSSGGVRKNTRRIINMQIWNAERVFPQARNCQVWAWSSGLTNYICTWQESGELEAKASHDKGVETVKQCLTEQWKSDFVQTSSGGGHTFFPAGRLKDGCFHSLF